MRVLLSTIGSRGEVQPVVALALQLRALDQDVRICAPPDFRDWIAGFGIAAVSVGPEVRPIVSSSSTAAAARPSPERLAQMAIESVAAQFAAVTDAATDCDIVVACGALQIAARSVTDTLGNRYVYACFCPTTLPSLHHAPPVLGLRGDSPTPTTTDHRALWEKDALRWNDTFGAALNAHRIAAGLPSVSDVRSHIFTDNPWLAADRTLAPWPEPSNTNVFQTGAWMLPDSRPLSAELDAFIEAGEPPVYFGFGSMRAPRDLGDVMIRAARALGRRAIVSRGWAELSVGNDRDAISVGGVNHPALFQRVAAVVHHGGAGTTTAAARAGAPQVIVPQMYDQFYWAERVEQLGVGIAHAPGTPTADALAAALARALDRDVAARARSLAADVRTDGATVAARRLIGLG